MGHLRALDGLRGIAVMAVVAFHSHVLPGGFVGVDLFFALSGFLITSLLLHEHRAHGDIALKSFWARRLLRLAPALVAAVVFAVFASASIDMELRPSWVVASLLYVSNMVIAYGDTYPIGLVSHTWSLAMEEQFYLVWPIVLAAIARRGAPAVCGVAAALCIVPLGLRFGYALLHAGEPLLWHRLYFAPEMRIDAIAAGCLAGGWLAFAPPLGKVGARAIGGAALLGAAFLVGVALTTPIASFAASPLLFSFTAFGATAVVVGAARLAWLSRVLSLPPFVGLGKISYGLYLVHVILFPLMMEQPLWMRWFVAIVLAAASHLWLEKPFLRFKARFERKPPSARLAA